MNDPKQPAASRPYIPDYGIPESGEGMLLWSHVTERLAQARSYWVATTRPDGRPHAVPVWGVYVGETLYFGGGPRVRWMRNLQHNPAVAVHLESADDVVIVEGVVEQMAAGKADPDLLTHIADAYEAKYAFRQEPPLWAVRPRVVLAWTSFPADSARWIFRGD
jgi:hypothetical protein